MRPLAAVLCVLALTACDGGSGPAEGAAGKGAAASSATADPLRDPAAWKALPAAERARLVSDVSRRTDLKSVAAVRASYELLKERAEDEGAAALVTRRVEVDPNCAWARGARGEVDVRKRMDQCLKECELAESEDVEPVMELRKTVGAGAGPKWVDAATAQRVDELIAAVRKEDARLSNPYEAAIAKWVGWQHGYHVMRDHAEIHATTGPYLVFVSIGGERPGSLSAAAEKKARGILDEHVKILGEVQAAWAKDVAAPLELCVYGPENCKEQTVLKANVFTEPNDYFTYQFGVDSWDADFAAAHYVDVEPRFLAAMTGPRGGIVHDASFRAEAVRQLVHFHTWDATRKARDRELDYSQCLHRPLWSAVGFPRFFAHHTSPPTTRRPWLGDVFVGRAVAEKKKWSPWTMQELCSVKDRAELAAASRRHAGPEGERGIGPLSSLFLGRASSLADFLWNAEDAGKPKYRDRYLAYLRNEMVVKTRVDHTRQEVCIRVGADDFKRAFGLTDDAATQAFENEWSAFESAAIAREPDPSWPARVTRTLAEVDEKK